MKEEIKEITNKMIKTSQPNGVFLTAEVRDKIIYYINNSLEEIERLHSIIKEVREYIEKHKHLNWYNDSCYMNDLLEILDKENK